MAVRPAAATGDSQQEDPKAAVEFLQLRKTFVTLFSALPVGICLIDSSGTVSHANRSFADLLGLPDGDVAGRPIRGIAPPLLMGAIEKIPSLPGAEPTTFEMESSTSGGRVTVLEATVAGLADAGTLLNAMVILTDLGEREKLAERGREIRHLESLATLAGGVAHDFNNLLTIIMGYASLLRDVAGDRQRVAHIEKTILDAGRRGAEVVKKLMLFANLRGMEMAPTDIHRLIEETIGRMTWPAEVRIERDFGARDPLLMVDGANISQCLEQLFSNACEAMPTGGTLTVRTAEGTRVATGAAGPTTPFFRLTVEDTGCGMDKATQARIFEPFFAHDKGPLVRGLGLAVVYGVMRAHGASIEVDSAPGRGTRFHLFFPTSAAPESSAAGSAGGRAAEAGSAILTPTGGGSAEHPTVLFVEDEPDIGLLMTDVIRQEGYPVLWARDGEEALRLYKNYSAVIGIVFTDVGLPGIDGIELCSRLRAADPRLPVLLVSGYFKQEPGQQPGTGPTVYLQKPYRHDTAISSIERLLEERRKQNC